MSAATTPCVALCYAAGMTTWEDRLWSPGGRAGAWDDELRNTTGFDAGWDEGPWIYFPGASGAAFAPDEEVLAMGTVDLDGAGPWQAPLLRQWRSRVVLGRAEFNASRLPWTAEALRPGLSAVDGGDFWIGRSEGYPDRSVDGGEFSAGELVLELFPELADGGDFSS